MTKENQSSNSAIDTAQTPLDATTGATADSPFQEDSNVILPHVMRNKNYFLLWFGAAVSNVGATFYHFAISFYILSITGNSATTQGLYLFITGVVYVVSSIFGGVLADRWNRVRIVYFSDYIRGAMVLIAAVVIYFASTAGNVTVQLAILFLVGIVFNVISAVFGPAINSLIPDLVHPSRLQQANSYFSILGSIQSIFGIVLASALYSALPVHWLFVVVALCYIGSAISEMFIRCPHKRPEQSLTVRAFFADLKDGYVYIIKQKGIVTLMLGVLFINFFISPVFGNGLPYFVKQYIEGSDYLFSSWKNSVGVSVITPETWSAIFSVFNGVGSLAMGFIAGRAVIKATTKYSKPIRYWLMVMGISLALMAVTFYIFVETGLSINTYLCITCGIMLASGVSVVGVNVPIMTVIQRNVERDKMAKVWSLLNIGSQGLIPIASLVGGLIIDNLGLGILFATCGVGFLIMSVLIFINKWVKEL